MDPADRSGSASHRLKGIDILQMWLQLEDCAFSPMLQQHHKPTLMGWKTWDSITHTVRRRLVPNSISRPILSPFANTVLISLNPPRALVSAFFRFDCKRLSVNMRLSVISSLALAASALALPLEKRQSSTTCGNNYYSSSQVQDALNQGYNYYAAGQQVGSDNYPHTYK